jgi:hypothetical protein
MTRERKPIEHGTNSGWSRHYADGDVDRWKAGKIPPCEPCIAAHNRYNAQWRANRAAPRPRRENTSIYRKRATSRVPHHVLGVLLASAPDDVALWAEQHLPPFVVERATWHAEHTDDLPSETADRSAA